MDIKEEIEGVVGDYFPKDEVGGITEHILYYTYKYSRITFAWGVIAGVVLTCLILAYFA